MRYQIFLFILFFLFSDLFSQNNFVKTGFDTSLILNSQWYRFYSNQNNNLLIKAFNLLESDQIIAYGTGNIFADFDSKFPKCNRIFIIESPDKLRYIDFLSYNSLILNSQDSCKILGFEVDQEVDLVDRVNKTVKRIGFTGSFETVEDAIWVGNSKVLLLCCEIDQEKGMKLFFTFMDFEKHEYSLFKTTQFFHYSSLYLQRKYGFK